MAKDSPNLAKDKTLETMEIVTEFIFLGSKVTADGDCSLDMKRRLFLGRKTMKTLDTLVAQTVNNLLAVQETRVPSLERKWQSTPVFLPGEFRGQRSLAGYRS